MITPPKPKNFFLQSHSAIQGTARSAHYHILTDDMRLGEQLPRLTMMLRYAFGRATTGVSYAAPAYIADRLCEQGRAYLRPWMNDPEMEPCWEPPKDADERPLGKDEFLDWKREKALELSKTRAVWGPNYKNEAWMKEEEKQLNPWHPNLDKGMFWM